MMFFKKIVFSFLFRFSYEYSLEVNGKSYEKFCENQSKILQSWTFVIADTQYRVVLEKNTMDLWVNGNKLDVEVNIICLFSIKTLEDPPT